MANKPGWHAQALFLREHGWQYDDIARHIGVSRSAVWRVCNPEADQRIQKKRQAAKNAWGRVYYVDTCHCGELMRKGSKECEKCHDSFERANRRFKDLLIVEMWNDGCKSAEIAKALGWKPGVVNRRVSQLRRQGHQLQYRRPDVIEHARALGHRPREKAA